MTNSKSKIVATRSDEETKENSAKRLFRNNRDEDRGGMLMIRGLWARSTDCIVDVRVTDVDAKSNRSKDPHKVLAAHEREKKKKCLGACHQAISALLPVRGFY